MSKVVVAIHLHLHKIKEAYIQKELFEQYVLEFFNQFALKQTYFYRFGRMSGNVIFEPRMGCDIIEFAQSISTSKKLEQDLFETNLELSHMDKKYLLNCFWYDMDRFVFENYKNLLIKTIFKVNQVSYPPVGRPLETKSYPYEGKQVVFFECEDDIFAVPVDVATEIALEDYDEEGLTKDDDFLDKVWQYRVEEDLIAKAEKIKAYYHG